MKIVDVDLLFEKYVREQMKKDAGKFTEDEWEDRVPTLYAEFGKKPLKALDGKSAEGYYKSLSGSQLCQHLKAHIEEEVPVSDYLCDAIVSGDTESGLLAFLKRGTDEELTSYAVNILNDKACFKALPIYLDYVTDEKTDENMREIMGDVLIENANLIKSEIIKKYPTSKIGKEILIEALSCCGKDESIYDILISEFKKTRKISEFAHVLVKYGDERAIDVIKERIEEPALRYNDFVELKYAIEALGGEYEGKRDFSQDRTYKKIKNYS